MKATSTCKRYNITFTNIYRGMTVTIRAKYILRPYDQCTKKEAQKSEAVSDLQKLEKQHSKVKKVEALHHQFHLLYNFYKKGQRRISSLKRVSQREKKGRGEGGGKQCT